jgi:hypothetical protein
MKSGVYSDNGKIRNHGFIMQTKPIKGSLSSSAQSATLALGSLALEE